MVEYFLASLTIPDDEMWVNLSPYEKDWIISEGLGLTSMGRDLLAQDYMLTGGSFFSRDRDGDAERRWYRS